MDRFSDLKNKKVMAAMSGGVDSSVAAYLLKKAGYEVIGATMRLGIKKNNEGLNNPACSSKSMDDAEKVCHELGIDHYFFDFSSEMKKYVIDKFIDSYTAGYTPNPCVLCNRFLKFGFLLEKAKSLGCDFIATGHYADIAEKDGSYFLKKPADKAKDQTYFLYSIKKENLKYILFPLARHTKAEVRNIAMKAGLPTASKKESQEVCFIPDNNYGSFMEKNSKTVINKPGNILNTEGKIIGKHKGIAYYTIGQRKGLGISAPNPLYVTRIDAGANEVVLGEREHVRKKRLYASELNLFSEKLPERLKAKIRYNHKEADCTVKILSLSGSSHKTGMPDKDILTENYEIEVIFDDLQEAVTPGQSIVFYENDMVTGGAVIKKVEQ